MEDAPSPHRRKLGECTLENETIKIAKTDAFVNTAHSGDLRAVLARLKVGQEIDLLHSSLDFTALHAAVDAGHFDVVASLIKHGANIHAVRQVRTVVCCRARAAVCRDSS